ncbi:hypothetical protein TrVE_jg8546 [Triparma verrucosa]|uniref:ABC transporter domain-containing protein n=1 Tax=Triparma verrucosa TaxID=1606542 RepID=A0A9W7KUB0_9STRA|nr:hypothetical protein TrVE_jg8546 [Triparma verrucosa]
MSPNEPPVGLSDIELSSPQPNKDKMAPTKTSITLCWSGLIKKVLPPPVEASFLKGNIGGSGASTQQSQPLVAEKQILSNVSGFAYPGEVLALMGPSGSGKTTLLDCLSNRSAISEGSITLNGIPLQKQHKRMVAYVTQSDIFFEHLTVRDQLLYTALLRLPEKMDFKEKVAEVDRVIDQLKLNKCQDTPIMLISGGEKKRTNIGTELLTDPQIILLDEPTSGLDSTSAVALMRTLRVLAAEGKTILTSIHQPSSSVFQGFDKLCLLADGNMVYFGSPSDSLSYFEGQGFPCPASYNAADHVMDLLVVDSGVEAGDTKQKLIAAWDDDKTNKEAVSVVAKMNNSSGSVSGSIEEVAATNGTKWASSYLTQLKVLTHRAMRNSRSAIFTWLNFVKSAGLGVISGLIWFQLGEGESWVEDRAGFIFFAMTFWVFDSMFTAMMTFPPERAIIFKERSSGSYRLSAYFLSKTVAEAPLRLTLPFTYLVISYWLANLNPSAEAFFPFLVVQLMSVLAGESIGLLIGATVMDMQKAMVVGTLVSLAMMLSGGFFAEKMEDFVSWVQYFSPFKYSYHACLEIGFFDGVKCDGSGGLGSLCESVGTGNIAPGPDVVKFLGGNGTIAFNISMLMLMSVLCRLLAYYQLRRVKGEGRHA